MCLNVSLPVLLVCYFIRRCRSFNPSLCRLSPFQVSRCFDATSLVQNYPNITPSQFYKELEERPRVETLSLGFIMKVGVGV